MTQTLIPVVAYSARIQHFAAPGSMTDAADRPGRFGHALCHGTIKTTVYDQVALEAERSRWGARPRPVVVTALPPCKKCTKAAELHGWALPAVAS
jgi:hypothetical protein